MALSPRPSPFGFPPPVPGVFPVFGAPPPQANHSFGIGSCAKEQTEQTEVKPSLAEITRETPATDVQFEETIVQRLGDRVLLQFYLQDDGRMHEATFKPIPSFCADIDRLLEVVKIAASQQDPDIQFKMEKKTNAVQLHLLVTLRTALGVDERGLTASVSVVDEERSMWHRMSREVRGLREENAALKSRLEHQESRLEYIESTHVVFAVASRPDGRQENRCFSTQLVCNTLHVPINSYTTYFVDVMDNVHAKTVRLVQDQLQHALYVQHQQSQVQGHALFRNKHASQLILEVTAGVEHHGYEGNSSPQKCWTWVHKVLGNFPKVEVVYIIVAGSHPPEDAIKEFAHLRFVFRAKWRKGCPDPWRGVAERNGNVSIEYTDREETVPTTESRP